MANNNSRLKEGLKAAGRSMADSGKDMMDRASEMRVTPVQYKRGGKVRKVSRRSRAKRRR